MTRRGYHARWSPDGEKIAFVTKRDGNFDLYVMNADGSGLRRLTRGAAWDGGPAWSPDGRKFAFVSKRDGNDEVSVINVDGTGLRNLTRSPAQDGHPKWSSDARKIASSATAAVTATST